MNKMNMQDFPSDQVPVVECNVSEYLKGWYDIDLARCNETEAKVLTDFVQQSASQSLMNLVRDIQTRQSTEQIDSVDNLEG